jgi:DNA-binding transcriptional LysR family regulator
MFHELGATPPANVVETSALPVIIAVLQKTDMVAVLPAEAVQAYCASGLLKILSIPLNVTMDSFGLITRRRHALSPGAEVALKILRETAAKLYPRGKSIASARSG